MVNTDKLKNLVYALTLGVRKNKRELWLKKGFKKVNKRKDFLLNYWVCRLAKQNEQDLKLYEQTLKDYEIAMRNAKIQAQEKAPEADKDITIEKTSNDGRILATPSQMVASAGVAAAKWIKGGLKTLDEEKIKKRLDICKTCDFWDSAALNGTGRCRKCGCSTWAKIRMPAEECPEKKWLAEA